MVLCNAFGSRESFVSNLQNGLQYIAYVVVAGVVQRNSCFQPGSFQACLVEGKTATSSEPSGPAANPALNIPCLLVHETAMCFDDVVPTESFSSRSNNHSTGGRAQRDIHIGHWFHPAHSGQMRWTTFHCNVGKDWFLAFLGVLSG